MFSCKNAETHTTKIIAHRGYWKADGAAQNSLASLRMAAEAGCYGSEFDVHLTADGVAVVFHDDEIEGRSIHLSDYSDFGDFKLPNGERLPTLEKYLQEGAKHPGLKLILEIKSASSPEHESRSVSEIMKIVEASGVRDRVEYIAFSYHICKEIIARDSSAIVAYLNGDMEPSVLAYDGLTGLDYNINMARNNPALFDEACKAGITTNVWTVNNREDMEELISYGADYITTDEPVLALSLVNK